MWYKRIEKEEKEEGKGKKEEKQLDGELSFKVIKTKYKGVKFGAKGKNPKIDVRNLSGRVDWEARDLSQEDFTGQWASNYPGRTGLR